MPVSLSLSPPDVIQIGGGHSMQEMDGKVYHFFHLEVVDVHEAGDVPQRNWRIAVLVVECGLKRQAVADAFGLSMRTVQRLAKRYREEGKEGILRERRPRSRVVVNAGMARRATALLAEGKSKAQVAAALGIARSTFHENLRAGWIAGPQQVPTPSGAMGPAERENRDRQAPMGRGARNAAVRAAAGREEAAPVFAEPAMMVPRGGVLTALPALVAEGLPGSAAQHMGLPNSYYGLHSVLLFLAFLFLARVRHPERLRYQSPGEWGQILGLDRCPEVRTLRRQLRALSVSKAAVGDWQRSLARSWMAEADGLMLAVDGHVKVYSGRKGNLPKRFVPRQKLCLKASSSCWINTLDGSPLLCIHRQLDPGLVKALRTEVVPSLEELGVLPQDGPDLTAAGCGTPALTLVFDREGWSPLLFRQLARRGVAVITWRKGRKAADWAEEDFTEQRVPLSGPGGPSETTVRLAAKKVELLKGFEVHEIRRLRPCGRQSAVISTHPTLPAERLAGALFSRWSQENFFKYMRQDFALDALTFRGLEPVDPEARVANPARRTIETEIRQVQSSLAAVRGKMADLRKQIPTRKNPEAAKQRLEAHKVQESDLAGHLTQLAGQRVTLPKTIAAGTLPEDQRLDALPQAERTFIDLIRMIVYRAETRMMPAIAASRAGGGKPNERALLRNLFTSPADILPEPEAGILRIRIRGQASAACEASVKPLLRELNRTRTIYPGTRLRMVYESAAAPLNGA